MYDVNDTGINKCYEGPARGTGIGHRIETVEKKAYRTRNEREVDRQKRATNERNALYAGAGATGVIGAALAARSLKSARPAIKTAGEAIGNSWFPKKTVRSGPGKGKDLRRPNGALLGAAAATAAAPTFYTVGRGIDRHMSEEWR